MEEETKRQLSQEELKTIEILIQELFNKLDVVATFSLEQKEDILDVLVASEDTGIIIGYHGEVLESLQLLLSLLIAKKINMFYRVSIEVGDYKKNRTEYLEKLALQMKDRVLDDGREQTMSSLKSWERRIIHLLLQDDKDVVSESLGEGKDRILVIKPKS